MSQVRQTYDCQSPSKMMEWSFNEFQGTRPAAPPPPYPGVPGAQLSTMHVPMSGRRLSLGSSTETRYSQHASRLTQPVPSAMTRTKTLGEVKNKAQAGESKPQVTQHISRLRERLKHGRQLFRPSSASSRAESYTNVEENESNTDNSETKNRSYSQPWSIHQMDIQQNRPIQRAGSLTNLFQADHIQKDHQHSKNNKAATTHTHNREKRGSSPVGHHTLSIREKLKQGRKLVTGSASSQRQHNQDQNVNLKTKSYQESEKAMTHLEAETQETKVIVNPTDPGKLRSSNLDKVTIKHDIQEQHVPVHRAIGRGIGQSHTQRHGNTTDLEQKVNEIKTPLSDYEAKLTSGGSQLLDTVAYTSAIKQKMLELGTLSSTVKGQLDYTGVLESQLREANKHLQDANEQVKKLNEERRNQLQHGNMQVHPSQLCKDGMNLLQHQNRRLKDEVVTARTAAATSMVDKASSANLVIQETQNKVMVTEELCNLQQMQDEASALNLENDELKRMVAELKGILIEVRSENLRLRSQCEKQTRDITVACKTDEEKERAWKLLTEDHNLLKKKYEKMSVDMETMVKEKEQSESNIQQLCRQLKEIESKNLLLNEQTKAAGKTHEEMEQAWKLLVEDHNLLKKEYEKMSAVMETTVKEKEQIESKVQQLCRLEEVESKNLKRHEQTKAAGKTHEERERAWELLTEDHNLLKKKYERMSAVMETTVKEKEQSKSDVLHLCRQLKEMESKNMKLHEQKNATGQTHEEMERDWKLLVEDHNLLKKKYEKMSAVMETTVKEKEQSQSDVLQLCRQLKEMESKNLQLHEQTKVKDIEIVKVNQTITEKLKDNAEDTRKTRGQSSDSESKLSQTRLHLEHIDESSIRDAGSIPSTLDSGQECPTKDIDTYNNPDQLVRSHDEQQQVVESVEVLVGIPKDKKDYTKQESGSQVALDKLQSLQMKYSNLIKSFDDYKGHNGTD